jgi:hypothetical protein
MDDAVAIAADTADARRASCGSNDRAFRQAGHPDIGRQTFSVQRPMTAGMRPVARGYHRASAGLRSNMRQDRSQAPWKAAGTNADCLDRIGETCLMFWKMNAMPFHVLTDGTRC